MSNRRNRLHLARPESGVRHGQWPLRFLLFGLIVLLIGVVLISRFVGERDDALSRRLTEVILPAQDALQDHQVAVSEAVAAARGYQVSGDTLFLASLRDAMLRVSEASGRLAALSRRFRPVNRSKVDDYIARSAEWAAGPSSLLRGEISREDLSRTSSLGQRRMDAVLTAADSANATLTRARDDLDNRLDAARLWERRVVALLALAALAIALAVIWLLYRFRRLAAESTRQTERLRVSEERFRLIAENLREAIWISDPAYTAQYYLSPAYEQIWGRPIEEAMSNPRSFLESVHPADLARVRQALQTYARGEYHVEYRIVRPDGGIRWISARGYPVRDEGGNIFGIAGIAEDITEPKRVAAEREELLEREQSARAETESALRMRDRVLRIVSHDLKNPLHTIGMAAELLEMPLSEQQRQRQIDIIRRTVTRANRLVMDLLDVARIESGQAIAIVPHPQSAGRLVNEAIDAFRLQAETKHQRLIPDIASGLPPVRADHDRMLQVLSNLIGNAIKFTPEGGEIRVCVVAENDDEVRFSVADSGPGIPTEVLPELFKPFTQARQTASLGTGLGLSIARGIVEAHGGRISVESEPGVGTTFAFVVPSAKN